MNNELIRKASKSQLIELFKKYIRLIESHTGDDWISHYEPGCYEYLWGVTEADHLLLLELTQLKLE